MTAEPYEDDPLARLRDGEWLDAQEFPPVAWAVPGLLPEGFGLFTGAPKAGKSWAALGIALAVATGTPALGKIPVGDPRPVLLLALEDGDRRLQGRCRHLLADAAIADAAIPKRMEYCTAAAPNDVLRIIEAWLGQHGHERPLVVLDTLGKVMPPALPGESAYSRDYRIGGTLKGLVDAHPGACLLVVHHTRKLGGPDWMDSTSGTQGLNGAADWTANLTRGRGGDAGVLRVTGRDVPEGEYAVTNLDGRWIIDGNTLAEAAQAALDAQDSESLGDRSTQILNWVKAQGVPVTPAQVQTALGIPDARRYLARLAETGRITRASRGNYTTVPTVPSVPTSGLSLVTEPRRDTRDTWDTPSEGTPCAVCGFVLDPDLAAAGDVTHPTCEVVS